MIAKTFIFFYWHNDVVRAFIELLHRLRKIDFRHDVRSHASEKKSSHSRSATNQPWDQTSSITALRYILDGRGESCISPRLIQSGEKGAACHVRIPFRRMDSPNGVGNSDSLHRLFFSFARREGFNILLYGFGSKMSLVEKFCEEHLSGQCAYLTIMGHESGIGLKEVQRFSHQRFHKYFLLNYYCTDTTADL